MLRDFGSGVSQSVRKISKGLNHYQVSFVNLVSILQLSISLSERNYFQKLMFVQKIFNFQRQFASVLGIVQGCACHR